jgi:hypothetical protein
MVFTNNLPNTLAYCAKERVPKFTSCIVSALAFSQISRYKFFNSLKLQQLQQTLLINLGLHSKNLLRTFLGRHNIQQNDTQRNDT